MTYIQNIYNFDYLVFAKNFMNLIRDWIKYREFIKKKKKENLRSKLTQI